MSIKWSTCSSLHLADCLTSVVGPGPDRLVSNNEAGQKMLYLVINLTQAMGF